MSATTVDQLIEAMKGSVRRPELAQRLGLAALEAGREDEALTLVAAAAEANPRNAVLLHILGLLHRALDELEPAIAAFDSALTFAPDSPRLVHARARASIEAGLPSLEWFAKARRLAPNDAEVIQGQFAALAAEETASAADDLLMSVLRKHPGWIEGHTALIKHRFATDRRERWSEELDHAMAGSPLDPRLHHLRMMVVHRAGTDEEARAAVDAALSVVGEVEQIRASAAAVSTEHGDLDRADSLFAGLNPAATEELTIHWCRHLLRRQSPAKVISFATTLPKPLAAVAAPYLSHAYRLKDDPRGAWLDDPRLVKVVDLGEDWPQLAELATTLRQLHLSTAQPLDQSVRGGTQTDGPLFSRIAPPIKALRERVLAEVSAYIDALPPADPAHPLLGRIPRRPRFAGSWSVRLVDEGYHESHIHNEGWLSSAFYVRLPDKKLAQTEGWLHFGKSQDSLNLDLEPTQLIEPRPGRLILFPSTQWHGTVPFSEGERMTVAFDIR